MVHQTGTWETDPWGQVRCPSHEKRIRELVKEL